MIQQIVVSDLDDEGSVSQRPRHAHKRVKTSHVALPPSAILVGVVVSLVAAAASALDPLVLVVVADVILKATRLTINLNEA